MPERISTVSNFDAGIVGGGIIGVSVALELQSRGYRVAVLERGRAGERIAGQASWAAAGMLAVDDPHNPAELLELSRWSKAGYGEYLDRLRRLGAEVRYQTRRTLQYDEEGLATALAEHSLDPRELMRALEAATAEAGIAVLRGWAVQSASEEQAGVRLRAGEGQEVVAAQVIWAQGAWSGAVFGTVPRKGQMMRVSLPEGMERDVVHRAEDVYIVPRTHGPQAGSAVVGATVEDCGFDAQLQPEAFADLRRRAARLVPQIASERNAPLLEAWCGFRPGSPSGLPILGRVPGTERQFVATGHFRNGILLAPGTARVLADMVEGKAPEVDVSPFAPERQIRTSER